MFRLRMEAYNRLLNQEHIRHAYSADAESILHLFKQLANQYLNEKLFRYDAKLPAALTGSKQLRSIAWHMELGSNEMEFVDYIWNEAIGDLKDLFDVSDGLKKFKIDQVSFNFLCT